MNNIFVELIKEASRVVGYSLLLLSFMLPPAMGANVGTTVVVDDKEVLAPVQTEKEKALEAKTEAEIRKQFGDKLPVLEQMVADINKHSYVATLRLCQGYRKMAGLGDIPGMSKAYRNKFKITTKQAFKDWLKVGGHGFAASFHIYLDETVKGTNNEIHSHRISYSFDDKKQELMKYFGSVYLFYLFKSEGYKKASKDCLALGNTGKYSQTHYDFFKKMLIGMDSIGTGAGLTVGIAGLSAVAYAVLVPIAKALKPVAIHLAIRLGAMVGAGAVALVSLKAIAITAIVVGVGWLLWYGGKKAYEKFQIEKVNKEASANVEEILNPVATYDYTQAIEDLSFLVRLRGLYATAKRKDQDDAADKKLYPLKEIERDYHSSFEINVLKKQEALSRLCKSEAKVAEEKAKFKKLLIDVLEFENKEIENCV